MSYSNQQIARQVAEILKKNKKLYFQKGITSSAGINKEIPVFVGGKQIRALAWNVTEPGVVNVFYDEQNKRYIAWSEQTPRLKRETILVNRKTRPDEKKYLWEYFIKVLQSSSIEGFDADVTLQGLPSNATIAGFKNTGSGFDVFAYKITNDELIIYKQDNTDRTLFAPRTVNKEFFTNNFIPANPTAKSETSLVYLHTYINNPSLDYVHNNTEKPPNTETYTVYSSPYQNILANKQQTLGTFYVTTPPGQSIPSTFSIDRIGNYNLSGTHPSWPYREYRYDQRTTVSSGGSSSIVVSLHPDNILDVAYQSTGTQTWNHTRTGGGTTLYDSSLIIYDLKDPVKIEEYVANKNAQTQIQDESSYIIINKDTEQKLTFTTTRTSSYDENITRSENFTKNVTPSNGIDNFNTLDEGLQHNTYSLSQSYNFNQNFTFNFDGINLTQKNITIEQKDVSFTYDRTYNREIDVYGDFWRTWYGWWAYSTSYFLETDNTIQDYDDIVTVTNERITPYIQVNKDLFKYVFVIESSYNINVVITEDYVDNRNIVYDYDIYNVPGVTLEDNQVTYTTTTVKDIDYTYGERSMTAKVKVGDVLLNLTTDNAGYYIWKSDATICANIHATYLADPNNISLSITLSNISFFYGLDLSNVWNASFYQPKENVTRLRRRIDHIATYDGHGNVYAEDYYDGFLTPVDTNVVTTEKNNNTLSTYQMLNGQVTIHCKYNDVYYICQGNITNKNIVTTPDVFETVTNVSKTELNVSYKSDKKEVTGVTINITNIEVGSFSGLVKSNNLLFVVPKDDYTRILLQRLYGSSENINLYTVTDENNNETVELAIAEIPTTTTPNTLRADIYRFNTINKKWERRPNAITPVSPLTDTSEFISYHPTASNSRRKKRRPPR